VTKKTAVKPKVKVAKKSFAALSAARFGGGDAADIFSGAISKAGLLASAAAPSSSSSSSSSSDDEKKAELLKSFQAGAAGPVKGVDVVFSFDTTGSMSGTIYFETM